MSFEPSLEKALLFLRPKVAMKLFLNENMEEIRLWLVQTEKLFGILVIETHSIEDLCAMKDLYAL